MMLQCVRRCQQNMGNLDFELEIQSYKRVKYFFFTFTEVLTILYITTEYKVYSW